MNKSYCPPEPEEIDAYAREACTKLAETVDPTFSNYEIVRGFAGFIKLAARVLVKANNKQSGEIVDSRDERR
ncbi:MAG: hypothetical protein K8L99_22300 [Anaerolineae bacterium]|nr:hypothetical protein [Anaerolineae bacterium]